MPHPHPHQHQVAAMPRQLRHYLSGLRHEFGHVLRASSTLHLHLRNRVLGLLLASAVVDVIAAVGMFFLERGRSTGNGESDIHTYFDALFFCTAQLLTVSSLFNNPLSPGGKILDVALEAWGITIVAAIAGAFGAFFVQRGLERNRELRLEDVGS